MLRTGGGCNDFAPDSSGSWHGQLQPEVDDVAPVSASALALTCALTNRRRTSGGRQRRTFFGAMLEQYFT
jgi:hypothetical protein